MASFSCHAFGVSKRFRLERIVRPQAYAAKWPMASVMARQTETYARLTAARAGQGLPERSSPEARPSNTPTPRQKNQGVKIGRASCRERVCQYGSIPVVAGSIKK